VSISNLTPCRAMRCLNCSFEQQAGSGVILAVREFIAILSGECFVAEVAEGFCGHDDKIRRRTFHRAFRTLSLASPPAFVDSALVPGALDAVKSGQKEPKGPPPASRSSLGDSVEIFS
jgi:hypothetical protein